ncbi:MAG: tRNA uridine-5-carboxymethylaminomethyl(34) synthesis enzyme MnmG, partial [bacterium]|nr:tRNA uridine-5-carboxymethylaminomethyl(34) synthesis enzyme MnmG [bacterium]
MNPDVVVVGGGHAACEAAYVTSKAGLKTVLITIDVSKIGEMSCNVSIGGVGKAQVVKEIDALGGCMGIITDKSMTHFKMLNTSKGYAMWSARAQCDRQLYRRNMQMLLLQLKNLYIVEDEVVEIIIKNETAIGVRTIKDLFYSKVVVVTTGTFLNGVLFRGSYRVKGGRIGESSSHRIKESLENSGFRFIRLKTGTPARIWKGSIDYSKCTKQEVDEPNPFSIYTTKITNKFLDCYITYTNAKTHSIILDNLNKSAMYSGLIKGVGPRYCPSIEDKVFKFRDKQRHQVFL